MTKAKPEAPAKTAKPDKPVLLSGGNPQIPKGERDAPVRASIAGMSGWKQEVARVPHIKKPADAGFLFQYDELRQPVEPVQLQAGWRPVRPLP